MSDQEIMLINVSAIIRKGSHVKITMNGENFWMRIDHISKTGRSMTGIIDNELVNNDYKIGEKIKFSPKEIIQVWVD